MILTGLDVPKNPNTVSFGFSKTKAFPVEVGVQRVYDIGGKTIALTPIYQSKLDN